MKESFRKKLLLLTILTSLITITQSIAAASQTYYELTLDYDHGNLKVASVEIKILEEETKPDLGFYVARILNFEGKPMDTTFFKVPTTIYYDNINPETGKIESGGKKELEKVSFKLLLPHYPNAKEIVFYNENLKEIARTDVSSYSQTKCGDSICQAFESHKTCKIDCPSGAKDSYCDGEKDGKCDPDCTEKTDSDCKALEKPEEIGVKERLTENWNIILIILLVIIGLIFLIVKSRKKD